LVNVTPNKPPGSDQAREGHSSRPADDRDRHPHAVQQDRENRSKTKGQNTKRHFGSSRDTLQLCLSRANSPEFSPSECQFGERCKYEHDLRKYLKEGKREDLDTFNGACPVYEARGKCSAGWRCRFARAHSQVRLTDDGREELILLEELQGTQELGSRDASEEGIGVVNVVSAQDKIDLRKKNIKTPKADVYTEYLTSLAQGDDSEIPTNSMNEDTAVVQEIKDIRARFVDPPLLPSEKRRLYYGPETPVLAPLTTQGNLPFRKLCVELGAQLTWSEMALSLPLIQGEKPEWALMKAHQTELQPPKYSPKIAVVGKYDNARDTRFGAQIAGNKPWVVLKATEVLTSLCPHLRAIDLNCGCPIDLVYRQGAGSALLDSPGKLEKILRGMNAVSGEVPITVKIRMGTKDAKPTADKLVKRLAFGSIDGVEPGLGPCVAAITLHGRSRQQRYTRSADWKYIAQCAALVTQYNKEAAALTDTVREPDARLSSPGDKIYFVGNGDCYSHIDYYDHIENAMVDSVMVARGALIKPWLFSEIEQAQYLDKSASERLGYIESFCRSGLNYWGSDEIGVGTTRKFCLEMLSFTCRYVPIGILEHLPPNIQDRPPAYTGRNELETLLGSDDHKDWLKISEMFLGPAHKDFRYTPKHGSKSSSSYEMEAEG